MPYRSANVPEGATDLPIDDPAAAPGREIAGDITGNVILGQGRVLL